MVLPVNNVNRRSIAARIAAHSRWAKEPDRVAATAPARAGLLDKLRRQVDPENVLEPAERERRAKSALTAHMLALSLKSAKARARAL